MQVFTPFEAPFSLLPEALGGQRLRDALSKLGSLLSLQVLHRPYEASPHKDLSLVRRLLAVLGNCQLLPKSFLHKLLILDLGCGLRASWSSPPVLLGVFFAGGVLTMR